MKSKRLILLVEDDQVDTRTVQRALKDINVTNPLETVANGEEALAFLQKADAVRPGIILLDLNMPRMNGIEFLKIIKKHEGFRTIPVVVLTTSREEQDKIESFKLGVSGYMLKPVDYIQFVEVMRAINMYWTLSELPD